MSLKKLLSLTVVLYSSILVNAQSKILQTITSGAKTSATNKVVETADKAVNKTLNNILDGNIFKKKAGKTTKTDDTTDSKHPSSVNSNLKGATEIIIANIDYSSIVALADIIKSVKNVSDIQRTFSNGSGVINVTHNSKTEELLDDILKNTANKYEVAELNPGKITLKAKK